jgi:hypothetical protein
MRKLFITCAYDLMAAWVEEIPDGGMRRNRGRLWARMYESRGAALNPDGDEEWAPAWRDNPRWKFEKLGSCPIFSNLPLKCRCESSCLPAAGSSLREDYPKVEYAYTTTTPQSGQRHSTQSLRAALRSQAHPSS